MDKLDHKEIEKRCLELWAKHNLHKTPDKISPKGKKYILDMWPYPSGAGLHVGHVEGYTGTDIVARYNRMNGYSVMHPVGWDSFGLPAENYAIKTGVHPAELTQKSIATFKRQIDMTGLSYDWDLELDASNPNYYKWTQWLFILLYKRGLAYKKKAPVNWCPSCETVLANEQVVEGKCERCDTPVEKKEMEQWFFKITAYADQLLAGLDKIDWPNSTKAIQRNWIGRSEGYKIAFPIEGTKDTIEVFTTRPDTLHGATFLAMAVDHRQLPAIISKEKKPSIDLFVKSQLASGNADTKEKLGSFTGAHVINPATGKPIPVWVTNYVKADYGTGAIMGVPAHDERDAEFATKYGIDIVDMQPDDAMKKHGESTVSYHLRDWLISRQRYWGTPIPMIHCQDCGWNPVPEDQLPIILPTDVDFRPTGESPIARSQEFQKGVVCPKCAGSATREVDTMDTFVDSSWYFLRFADPHNAEKIFDRKKVDQWNPVDLYVGGEHATTHLIFSRFFVKVLYDAGLIGFDEPFMKLRMVGMITGEDSRKMSKRWGNVINPDDVVAKFGADTMRMYEMFMGPFSDTKAWSTAGIEGVYRFLNRFYRLFTQSHTLTGESGKVNQVVNRLVVAVTGDIDDMAFNTAVAAMMEALNTMYDLSKDAKQAGDWREAWKTFLLILAPFAPFVAEELYQTLIAEKKFSSVHVQSWPKISADNIAGEDATIVIQVNGVVRDKLVISSNYSTDQERVEQSARASAKVQAYINGAKVRTIFVPGKLINFVI